MRKTQEGHDGELYPATKYLVLSTWYDSLWDPYPAGWYSVPRHLSYTGTATFSTISFST